MKSQEHISKNARRPTYVLRLTDVDADEGPQPMRNCKPGAKNANAADQFWSDHQEEHEKRAGTPARVDVHQHNKVPRLEEPLSKMAAVSKIKASATIVAKQSGDRHEQRNKNSDKICHHCTKLRLMDKKKRHKTHRSYSGTKKVELKSRITKSNSRQKTIFKARISKSRYSFVEKSKKCRCQYCMRMTSKGTCTNITLKEASTVTGLVFDSKDAKRVTNDTDGSNTLNGSTKSDYTNSQNSVRSSMHSGSYNSNISRMSLDHEPMVTNEE